VDLVARRTAFPKELLDELQRIPGVVSVSVSTHTPLSGSTWSEPAVPTGQPLPQNDNAYFVGAGPRFFETLQTPLLAGREFTERDSGTTPGVAVVNEAFAARHFPNEGPVGQHLSAMVRGRPTDLEIVGVAKNSNLAGLRNAAPPAVYVPYYQLPGRDQAAKFTSDFPTTLEIRANHSLSRVAVAIRNELQATLPNAPIEVRSLSTQVDARLVQERLLARLAGAFGVLALILAFIGLYGLLAYGVLQQARETGIRMALGAQRSVVIATVVKRAFALVLVGIAFGLPAALVASRWVKSMLFGLTSTDPGTIMGAALLLMMTAVAAAYFPARRAADTDPMIALRHE
jgi:putative ABC transport system permease protein